MSQINKLSHESITVSEAGRRGGYATLQSQGIEHFKVIGRKGGKRTATLYRTLLSEFGKRGGRPRSLTTNNSSEEEDR